MTTSTQSKNSIRPVLGELTGRRNQPGWARSYDSGDLPEHILRSEGFRGSSAQGLFDLFEEMEQKDGHLFAVLQTRKNGVLSCPRKVVAASDDERDLKIAKFVDRALKNIAGFDRTLMDILDALGKGLSVQEILWEARDGHIVPGQLKSRAPGRFIFDERGEMRLNPWDAVGSAAAVSDAPPNAPRQIAYAPWTQGAALPERKFVRFTFGGLYDNPFGQGLCGRAYWYYWFKKNNLKFWVIFNEKFGAPTVIGKYGPGASDEDRDRLFEVVESLQNDTGVTVPESITIELLEARRSGNASTYRDLADWCNDEISKIVLGATLTSGEGRRGGSRALGEVHERVRNEYVEADARALEDAVNSQLVRPTIDFNFGPGVPAPRWTIDTTRDDHLERELAVDRQLIEAGVALPESYFREKYKRPAPIGDEPALRFDDRNLFQYHLRFGILTVNEARKRLGLVPVSWGEKPVQPVQLSRGASSEKESGLNLATITSEKEESPEKKEEEKTL